jgi:hypothetical protein
MFKVVAAPPKLTVVAVESTSPKVVEPVRIEVVKVGEVAKTNNPVPVSSDTEAATLAEEMLVARLLDPSVTTNLLAVRSGRLTTDDPESITMFPVVDPPRVSVWAWVVESVPAAVRYAPPA